MTVKWVTTPKERLGRKYRELHQRLKHEISQPPASDKTTRKRQNSIEFRARGGE